MMRMTRRHLPLFAALLAAGKTAAKADEAHEVMIDKLVFNPASITINAGDTMRWVNYDPIAHTATFKGDASAPAWEVMIDAGKSAELKLDQIGTFAYFCRFHPNMKAEVVVLEP